MVSLSGLPGHTGLYDATHRQLARAGKSLLLTSSSQVVADANDGPTSCELSAKSLLASPPVLFELAIFSLGLLLLLLIPIIPASMRFPPPRVISPSGLRVHLQLCIFRE